MRKFVFTYNATTESYEENTVREEIIQFLHLNEAEKIKQHVNSTFEFDSEKTIEEWLRLINLNLNGHGYVLEGGHYLLIQVSYRDNEYKIKRKSNPNLQVFVNDVLKELD